MLAFLKKTSLSDANLRRLLQNDRIQHLRLSRLKKKLALLPFSTKVDQLDYEICSSSLVEASLKSMNIVTSRLACTIHHEGETFPTEPIRSFLRRLADFGHFV